MKKSNIQLLNETKEKMRKLYEYSFYRQGVYEDDESQIIFVEFRLRI